MPDLGSYAFEVLSAYAATIGLLAVLVLASIWRARRVLKDLRAAEARRDAQA